MAPPPAAAASGAAPADTAPRVHLRQLRLEGCQALSSETLLAQLGPLPEQAQSLADIEALALRVARLYKRAGYPFVQVVVPPQRVSDGVLTLRVIEGRLGRSTVQSQDPLAQGAQAFLDAGLPIGQPIHEQQLERTMLLIDDQPGYNLKPILKPGAAFGESALVAQVERQNRVSGDVGIDNTGNRSTGVNRLKASLAINSPFIFGDRIGINAMSTDQNMWLGSLDYERPLGATGWRGMVGWSRTSYLLGGPFEALEASGYAETSTVKGSYYAVRSQKSNLLLSLALQHKVLQDRYDSVDLVRDKSSDLMTLAAQFDRRDALGSGGVTFGQISLTQGHLHLDDQSLAIDAATARSAGGFAKLNLDVARIQSLGAPWSVYARVSSQWSSSNLDSSEKFSLGGFLGVRAYPMGEGSGDRGWLAQTELRWSMGDFTPYLLFDAGEAHANAQPWDDSSRTRRTLSGAGLGLRWGHEAWTLEAAVAGRIDGHAAQAETPDRPVRAWLLISRRFN
jgi:hemolysin activation/secretion protein